MINQVLDALREHDLTGDTIRPVDHDIRSNVEVDMVDGDAWPGTCRRLLDADILAQRIVDRLDAELSESDDQGRPLTFGEVVVVAVVGNEAARLARHLVAEPYPGVKA